jgi:hypothetical protein
LVSVSIKNYIPSVVEMMIPTMIPRKIAERLLERASSTYTSTISFFSIPIAHSTAISYVESWMLAAIETKRRKNARQNAINEMTRVRTFINCMLN